MSLLIIGGSAALLPSPFRVLPLAKDALAKFGRIEQKLDPVDIRLVHGRQVMTHERVQGEPGSTPRSAAIAHTRGGSAAGVLRAFLRLGPTSFGGPVAHLGYFRTEFVERRRWPDEPAFADIVALCQFLPGPAGSQVGITLDILRAGLPGAFAAWLGFTTPSALAMILFGYGVAGLGDLSQAAWLHGLKIVAVAVVANAVWGMARNLCPAGSARR